GFDMALPLLRSSTGERRRPPPRPIRVRRARLCPLPSYTGQDAPGVTDRSIFPGDAWSSQRTRGATGPAGREGRTEDREVGSADRELGLTGREVGSADREPGLTGREVGSADRELGLTGREVGSADRELGLADREVGSADRELGLADREVGSADREVGS